MHDINVDLYAGNYVVVGGVAELVLAHQQLDVVNQVETVQDYAESAVHCLQDLATRGCEDSEYHYHDLNKGYFADFRNLRLF